MLISDRFDPTQGSPPTLYYAARFATWSKRRQQALVFVSAKTETVFEEKTRAYWIFGGGGAALWTIILWNMFGPGTAADSGVLRVLGTFASLATGVALFVLYRDRRSTRRIRTIEKLLKDGRLIKIQTRTARRTRSDGSAVYEYVDSKSRPLEILMRTPQAKSLWDVLQAHTIWNAEDLEKHQRAQSKGTFSPLVTSFLELLERYLRDEISSAEELGAHIEATAEEAKAIQKLFAALELEMRRADTIHRGLDPC